MEETSKTKKSTEYVIDSDGKYWLPPFESRMEGWARYNWFRKKMNVEGHTASASEWKGLTKKYPLHTLTDEV